MRRSQQVYQWRRDTRLARREQAARHAQIAATADRSYDEVWPAVAPKRGAWRPSVQRATSTVAAHRPRRRGCSRNPAGQENFSPALLCTTMWITCAKRRRACAHIGEMLGIVLPGRARNRAFTWESAIYALWMEKERELSTRHAAIAHK